MSVPDGRLLSDFEDWMLIKMDALRHTRSEIDQLPVVTIQHYIGFESGRKILEQREQERNAKSKNLRRF